MVRGISPTGCARDQSSPVICAPENTGGKQHSTECDRAIAGESKNQLHPYWGWEAESNMRVASLESVLAVATLVSAIVVVLWGIKIFCGV
jgi:hypothetical protein